MGALFNGALPLISANPGQVGITHKKKTGNELGNIFLPTVLLISALTGK